jgi:hypothetical protein
MRIASNSPRLRVMPFVFANRFVVATLFVLKRFVVAGVDGASLLGALVELSGACE